MEQKQIKKAIRKIKADIKEQEQYSAEYDLDMGCCDKSFSNGILAGLELSLSHLKNLLNKK